MENQHRLIKGYRELSAAEIAAMNAVKAQAEATGALIDEALRAGADPRWASIAQTQLQQGYMALVRSIAKPDSF